MLLQKLRDDLQRLPEDNGFQEFDDTPVEGFGKALLAGYGWKEGRGIGKNAKEDVEIVVQKRHTGKHGLGFVEKVDEPFRFSVQVFDEIPLSICDVVSWNSMVSGCIQGRCYWDTLKVFDEMLKCDVNEIGRASCRERV